MFDLVLVHQHNSISIIHFIPFSVIICSHGSPVELDAYTCTKRQRKRKIPGTHNTGGVEIHDANAENEKPS